MSEWSRYTWVLNLGDRAPITLTIVWTPLPGVWDNVRALSLTERLWNEGGCWKRLKQMSLKVEEEGIEDGIVEDHCEQILDQQLERNEF